MWKFSRGFYFPKTSHIGSFMKIKSSRNGEITLSFTDVGKSCPSHDVLLPQICLLMLFAKIKFLKNGEITLVVYWCRKIMPYSQFFSVENMPFNAIRENKILTRISGATVLGLLIRVHNQELISLFFIQNIWFGFSKEPSKCDGSFENPKHMFILIGKKILTVVHSKSCLWIPKVTHWVCQKHLNFHVCGPRLKICMFYREMKYFFVLTKRNFLLILHFIFVSKCVFFYYPIFSSRCLGIYTAQNI